MRMEKQRMIDIEQQVCADILRRQSLGKQKYGTTLANNPLALREWLEHQYLELLDAALYCKRAISEMDTQPDANKMAFEAAYKKLYPVACERHDKLSQEISGIYDDFLVNVAWNIWNAKGANAAP